MEKPGPRNSYRQIIDRPELKTPARKALEGSVTAILWAIWLYWMVPVVTAVLWIAGFRNFYQHIITGAAAAELRAMLANGGIIVIAIFSLNLIWINYNYHMIFKRFRNRRKRSTTECDTTLARAFQIDPTTLKKAKSAPIVHVNITHTKTTIT